MKVQILYASMTGHSRKLARAVGQALGVTPADAKKGERPAPCDLLLIIGGVYGGQPEPKLLEAASRLRADSVGQAAFLISSMTGQTELPALAQVLRAADIKVREESYACKGSFLFMGLGHPNAAEVAGAVEFARRQMPED